MYSIVVKLKLKNDLTVQGEAIKTVINESREECILLDTGAGQEQVVLEQIDSMEAVTSNPHFEKIKFTGTD